MNMSTITNKDHLYKTELCRNFRETGACRYGSKCRYAHGENEVRNVVRHTLYKTKLCRTYHETGFCDYGSRCTFIHDNIHVNPTATATATATATMTTSTTANRHVPIAVPVAATAAATVASSPTPVIHALPELIATSNTSPPPRHARPYSALPTLTMMEPTAYNSSLLSFFKHRITPIQTDSGNRLWRSAEGLDTVSFSHLLSPHSLSFAFA